MLEQESYKNLLKKNALEHFSDHEAEALLLAKHSYNELLLKIATDNFDEDEVESLELAGDTITQHAFDNYDGTNKISEGHGEHFGAADAWTVMGTVNIAIVALGGLKTFFEVVKLYKDNKKLNQENEKSAKLEELKLTLEEYLIKNKIKKDKAKAIAEDFISSTISISSK